MHSRFTLTTFCLLTIFAFGWLADASSQPASAASAKKTVSSKVESRGARQLRPSERKGPEAGKPIPTGPTCCTQKRFNEMRLQFDRRTILDAYKNTGPHDPKWNAAAERFLESYIVWDCDRHRAPGDDLIGQGKALIDSGCDDPLVLCCYGKALWPAGDGNKADEMLGRAVNGFLESSYPKITSRSAMESLIELRYAQKRFRDSQALEMGQKIGTTMITESLDDPDLASGEEQLIVRGFTEGYMGLMEGKWQQLCSAIQEKPRLHKYAALVIAGTCENKAGWDIRGSGLATKVKSEAWQGFFEHLKEARKLLVEAWKLRPDYPEAPAQMVSVAMCESDQAGENPRLWFDRAVAAQMDYMPAYRAFNWSLRPRWGGDLDGMYRFGVECLKTRRFDTAVPWEFYTTLHDISEEMKWDKHYWKLPQTTECLQVLFDSYAKTGFDGGSTAHYQSSNAAAAWYCERYGDARRLLDRIGSHVSASVFEQFFDVPYEDARAQTYALTGTFAFELQRAEHLRVAAKLGQALQIYLSVLEKLKTSDAVGLPFIRKRVGQLQTEVRFSKGEAIDLKPTADFAGWQKKAGEWVVDRDGSVRGTSTDKGLMLFNDADFGDQLEFQGEMEFASSKWPQSLNGGPIMCYDNLLNYGFVTVFAYKASNEVIARRSFSYDLATIPNVTLSDRVTFKVQLWENTVTIYVNGKLVGQSIGTRWPLDSAGRSRLGVGGNYWYPGAVLRFSNLQVRRLRQKPSTQPR